MPITWKQLKKTRAYEREDSYKEIIGDLQQIVAIDQWLEKTYKKFQKWLIISIIIDFIAFLATFAMPGVGFPVLFLSIIFTIIFSFLYLGKNGRLHLSKRRYEFTQKLLELINRDSQEDSQLQIHLSFQPVVRKYNQTQVNPHPQKPGWKLKSYEFQWLQLSGKFSDKTHFSLAIKDLFRQASGVKRSRSGKRKFKSKVKCKATEVFLHLKFSRKRYGAIQVLQSDVQNAIKLPENTTCKKLQVKDNSIKMRVKIYPIQPTGQSNERQLTGNAIVQLEEIYGTVVAMLLSSYQILNLARELSKKG
jgi:hypothetical protein